MARPLAGSLSLPGRDGSGKVGNEGESAGRAEAVTDIDGRYRIADLSEDFTYTVRVGFPMRDELVSPKSPRTQSDFLIKMEEQVARHLLLQLRFGSDGRRGKIGRPRSGRTRHSVRPRREVVKTRARRHFWPRHGYRCR